MRKSQLPNLLSALRIPLSLLLFAFAPDSAPFLALYTLCGLSDMLDGFLASRLNCASPFGARLDSFADFLFFAVAALRLLPGLLPRLTPLLWAGASGALLLRLAGCAVARARGESLAPLHSRLNRLTGLLLFLLPLLLPTHAFAPMAHIACASALLSTLDELFARLRGASPIPVPFGGAKARGSDGKPARTRPALRRRGRGR